MDYGGCVCGFPEAAAAGLGKAAEEQKKSDRQRDQAHEAQLESQRRPPVLGVPD